MAKKDTQVIVCSFCERTKTEVNVLVAGINGHICEKCVEQASIIIQQEMEHTGGEHQFQLRNQLKPKEIVAFLNNYVIGQDAAKKVLAVAVYNHYKRLNQKIDDEIEIEKSNILLVGNTGTGKTLLARSIAKFLNVPFTIVDATVFTEAGYVGEDVESILSRLLQVADYDVNAAQRGIIFIDEIDKIARKSDNPSITRDVSGEGVQQGMLKLFEGTDVLVPPQGGRKHPDQKMLKVNTSNILFICGGAFEGIAQMIASRMNKNVMGFKKISPKGISNTNDTNEFLKFIDPADIRKYGLIPELIGRLPVLVHLNPLDKATLRIILTEPKNALVKQFVKLFDLEGIKLFFDNEALDFIVDKAMDYNLGARGLRSICETIMNDAMYESPSNKDLKTLTITKKYAEEQFDKSDKFKLDAA